MSEPVRIAVVIKDGMVEAVLTAGVAVEFVTVDYDTDGAAPGDTTAVPQADGGLKRAYVSFPEEAETEGPFVMGAFEGFGRDDESECEGCGRPGSDCSADPCADVIADREG